MTNKEHLQKLLQRNVQLFGEDAPSTLDLKRQLREIEQRQSLSEQEQRPGESSAKQAGPYLQQFMAGFRKGTKEIMNDVTEPLSDPHTGELPLVRAMAETLANTDAFESFSQEE